MELSWVTIVLLLLATFGLWFWRDSLQVRDLANVAAIEACEKMGLQFLDGTVAFSKLQVVRDRGVLRLRRTYVFDYTAQSIERMQGFVVLLGLTLETVGFARTATPMQRAAPEPENLNISYSVRLSPPSIQSGPAATTEEPEDKTRDEDSDTGRPKAKVLNLDDWRTSRTRH